MKSLVKIFSKYKLHRKCYACLGVSFLFGLTSLLSLTYPKLYGLFVANLENNVSVNNVLLAYIAVICFSLVVQYLIGWIFGKFSMKLESCLRYGIYTSLSNHSEKTIKTLGQGYYENIMDSAVSSIMALFFPKIMNSLMGIARYIVILIILFSYSYLFGFLGLSALCFYVIAYFINRKFYAPMFLNTIKLFSGFYSKMVEALSMTTLFKSFPYFKSQMDKNIYTAINGANDEIRKTELFSDTIYRLVPAYILPLLLVVVMFICGRMYFNNMLGLSVLVTVVAYFSQLTSVLGDFDEVTKAYLEASESAGEVLTLIEREAPLEKLKVKNQIEDFFFDIRNLNLKIDDNRIIHIDKLKIEKNKKYALLGVSGAGKSTLLNALLGYEKVDGNLDIFSSGVNPYQYDIADKVLYISQSSYILNADITQNIELGVCNHERLEEVLSILQLSYLKNRDLGVDGKHISGGEKRLINIARIFYHAENYKYIILDEIFTSVDLLTKRRIFPLLKQLLENKSCIIVSHDLEEIEYFCSDIVSIENDSSLFIGSYEDAKTHSKFFRKCL